MAFNLYKSDVRVGVAPCRDCTTDRYPGCHDHCEGYLDWKARKTEVDNKDWDARRMEARLESYEVERSRTSKRRSHK